MARAAKQLSPYWFTVPGDEDETPTRWRIKPLSEEERTDVTMETVDGAQFGITGRGISLALKYGLIDWEDYLDADGEQIVYASVHKKNIPVEYRIALATEIINNSTLDADTEKK